MLKHSNHSLEEHMLCMIKFLLIYEAKDVYDISDLDGITLQRKKNYYVKGIDI